MDIKTLKSSENVSFHICIENTLAVAEISKMDRETFKNYYSLCKDTHLIEQIENNLKECSEYYFFNRLNVPVKLRGQKLGEALLTKVIDFCNQYNVALINTASNYGEMGQKNLMAFYKKSGMTLLHPDGLFIYHSDLKINSNKLKIK